MTYQARKRKKHSEETKRKIALGNTGKVFSQERKDAIGRANSLKLSEFEVNAAKKILDEKCCSFDAAMGHIDLKPTPALRKALARNGVEICDDLKFFNRSIDYNTGKKLLSYLKLNLHWTEIQERTGLGQKTIVGSCRKLEKVHGFKYNPARKKPGGFSPTKIELHVARLLEELDIEYEPEYAFDNFYYDFRIRGTSLLIEVNGDYWHANPLVYPCKKMINETQKKNVRRDHYKRRVAREHGFYVLYVWEYDLKNSPENVIITLERYVKKAYEKANNWEVL